MKISEVENLYYFDLYSGVVLHLINFLMGSSKNIVNKAAAKIEVKICNGIAGQGGNSSSGSFPITANPTLPCRNTFIQ